MNEMTIREADLLGRFRTISRDRMRGLPICNPNLEVEVVGFRDFEDNRLGVLITPWFMNLVLLPGDETWSNMPVGAMDSLSLPGESCELSICKDDLLGTYLSAILFRSVMDFPDQGTAVAVAEEVLKQLFTKPDEAPCGAAETQAISRRNLLTGLGAS